MADTDDETHHAQTPRAGRCAIVGRPNVGKSTLLNAVLKQKLVIATPRPGTTRANVLGVYASDDPPTQIAFMDTPGILRPKSALHKALVDEAQKSLADADVVVLLTAVGKSAKPDADERDLDVLRRCAEVDVPVIVAINKVDRLQKKHELLPLLTTWQSQDGVAAVVPISALRVENVDVLISEVRSRIPEGVLYEDAEYVTDRSSRFFAAELVREAILKRTRQEVPYGIAVLIDDWVGEEKITRIHASVIVEKESHKRIVIGKGGAVLKEVGTEARQGIEAMLGQKVFLKLWVKVEKGWTGDPRHVKRLTSEVGS